VNPLLASSKPAFASRECPFATRTTHVFPMAALLLGSYQTPPPTYGWTGRCTRSPLTSPPFSSTPNEECSLHRSCSSRQSSSSSSSSTRRIDCVVPHQVLLRLSSLLQYRHQAEAPLPFSPSWQRMPPMRLHKQGWYLRRAGWMVLFCCPYPTIKGLHGARSSLAP